MITISLATGRPVASGPEAELPAFRALVLERRDLFAVVSVDAKLVVTPGLPLTPGACSSCGSSEHISPLRGGDCAVCIVARFLAVDGMSAETRRERAAARTRELNIAPAEAAVTAEEITSIPSEPAALDPFETSQENAPAGPPLPPATARPLATPTRKGRTKLVRAIGSLF